MISIHKYAKIFVIFLLFFSYFANQPAANDLDSYKLFEKSNISKKNRIDVCSKSISPEFSIIIGFIKRYYVRANINNHKNCLGKYYDIKINSKDFPDNINYLDYFGKSYLFNGSLCKLTFIEANKSNRYVAATHIESDENQAGALNCILLSFLLYFDINIDTISLESDLDKETFTELMSKIVYLINNES